MLLGTQPAPSFEPQAPQTLKQAGLSQALVLDLVLRIAFLEGVVSLRDLAGRTNSAFRSCMVCSGICNTTTL